MIPDNKPSASGGPGSPSPANIPTNQQATPAPNQPRTAPTSGPVIDYRLTAPVQKGVAASPSGPVIPRSVPYRESGLRRATFPLIAGSTVLLGGVLIAAAWSRISGPEPVPRPAASRVGAGPRADLGAARHPTRPATTVARNSGGLILEPADSAPASAAAAQTANATAALPASGKNLAPQLPANPAKAKPASHPSAAIAKRPKRRSVSAPTAPRQAIASVTRDDDSSAWPDESVDREANSDSRQEERRPARNDEQIDRPQGYVVIDSTENAADTPERNSQRRRMEIREERRRQESNRVRNRERFRREARRHPAPGWDEQDDRWLDRY